MINRRVVSAFGAFAGWGGLKLAAAAAPGYGQRSAAAAARLRALEAGAQGRLGVHIIDTATGDEYSYRADERFMMLSSFKLLACAVVLSRVDAGEESLERRIRYSTQDLVSYSPVTQQYADGAGMTLSQLCEATLTTSDNTAANLILASCGGPPAVTALSRRLGDRVTRLDRIETALNVKHADPLLDTTTPRAMAQTMQKLTLGNALSAASRERLQQWLLGNTTGGKRLKAGLPADWRIGDKTGTNQTDANDIALIWPPQRAPWLVTCYLADSLAAAAVRESTIAQVGALVRELAAL